MNTAEFRHRGKQMVEYIAAYMETIAKRRVTPNVEPGYLRSYLPESAPLKAESWDSIMEDFEQYIMPGVTHWQHPRFHAYFPAGNSYPSILADMLSDGIGCVGFSWAASPVCTELEIIMLDWVGQMIGLPEQFLCFADPNSKGGGVIQGSASDCVLVCLLAARCAALKELKKAEPGADDAALMSKLVGYCSKEAHSCAEKAAMIALVKLRILDTDENFSLRGEPLKRAMEEDKANGLVPFFVSATLGTTSCCSFDALHEIGPICEAEGGVWLHVDAAYAGNAFICPEFRYLMRGIEYASSFNENPNKWALVNFDCSLLWVKDRFKLTQALVVDPLYLQHSYSERAIDYRHWGIPLSRRFRSLKLWFVIRNYGIEGLQKYIREHVRLAKRFEKLIRQDDRFEVMNQVKLGLVCFRLKGSDVMNQKFLSSINASGKLHMVPASLDGHYVIRFCVCAQNAANADIDTAYRVIAQFATDLFEILELEKRKNAEQNREETKESEDNEAADEVFMLDRKRQMSLRYKRSFFVRMVSDPKLYNPKIVKALNSSTSSLDDKSQQQMQQQQQQHKQSQRHASEYEPAPTPAAAAAPTSSAPPATPSRAN
ncbi:PREDICTED: tyrosine decarboxylase-like [Rhagoletis zephyria]|uniref:tyrosine decarboxylase-like n=1 Tax=Rhagoletis zephyria TaxID=28612 RepID=UPI000811246A|nr:PREDICTED: tyrosine decarboxylase-like [Rhagoletis zephyria]